MHKNYREYRPYISISSSTEKTDEQEFDKNEIVQWNEGQDQKWPFHEGDKVGNTEIDRRGIRIFGILDSRNSEFSGIPGNSGSPTPPYGPNLI